MIILGLKITSIIFTAAVLLACVILGLEVRRLNTKLIHEHIGHAPRKKKPAAKKTPEPATPAPSVLRQAQDGESGRTTEDLVLREIRKRWQEAKADLDLGEAAGLQLHTLNLDAAIDSLLRQRGFEGQTMKDRLDDAARSGATRVDTLMKAHRIRNRIAHDPGSVSPKELREAVEWYGVVLRDWRVIE